MDRHGVKEEDIFTPFITEETVPDRVLVYTDDNTFTLENTLTA